jgi:CHAD domain
VQTRSLRSTLTGPNAKALYRQENATFRELARRLSPFRDADVRLEAFDELLSRTAQRPEHFAPLRDLLLGGDQRDTPKALEEQFPVTAQEARAAEERLKKADLPNEPGFETH